MEFSYIYILRIFIFDSLRREDLNPKVMFGNCFYFLFSKTCFGEYNEKKKKNLVFLKSKICLVS